jgi:hypothetical protein
VITNEPLYFRVFLKKSEARNWASDLWSECRCAWRLLDNCSVSAEIAQHPCAVGDLPASLVVLVL